MSRFATLEIDPAAFEDIKSQLLQAGYGHTANYQLGGKPTIVMDGLAVQPRDIESAAKALQPLTDDALHAAWNESAVCRGSLGSRRAAFIEGARFAEKAREITPTPQTKDWPWQQQSN